MIVSLGDSEKALSSLPSPLTATDETSLSKGGGFDTIKVTAGLHRQVWVSGTDIFVDVHLANNSRKAIRRLDLSLERNILCYRHAAAATRERSASQARIFESNERAILSRSSLKHDTNGWKGVDAYSTDTRTCQLELPRGHATVKCGKYFEVRYFLNVAISTSHTKLVSNSLDVVPNSVAQVAAAIEEKRHRASRSHSRHASRSNTRTPHSRGPSTPSPAKANTSLYRNPSRLQGRAFAAPRQQSLDRMRAEAADLEQLGAILDSSPRKHAPRAATPAAEPSNAPKKMASMFSLGNISVDSYSILGGG
ncbi:hypothetical protein H2203_007772 [Taxawa tesnikishii (nom. ined.)]|nr:hypothetical protein H2203_007772 [Dothideales sp. JES 119]